MGHTYTKLLYHVVYSTKERRPLLHADWQENLNCYMSPIVDEMRGHLVRAGGVADHLHLLFRLTATVAVSKAVGVIKASTSKWINDEFYPVNRGFAWQEGYGAFSVSESNVPDVIGYIDRQDEHHRKRSFQDEFREILRRHEIEFDERYIWD